VNRFRDYYLILTIVIIVTAGLLLTGSGCSDDDEMVSDPPQIEPPIVTCFLDSATVPAFPGGQVSIIVTATGVLGVKIRRLVYTFTGLASLHDTILYVSPLPSVVETLTVDIPQTIGPDSLLHATITAIDYYAQSTTITRVFSPLDSEAPVTDLLYNFTHPYAAGDEVAVWIKASDNTVLTEITWSTDGAF